MVLGERQKNLVAALRSGKYKQTFGKLKRGDCYCALGVVCDISGLGVWEGDEYSDYSEAKNFFFLAYGLIELNDQDELSFEQIATVLEQMPDSFFYGSI